MPFFATAIMGMILKKSTSQQLPLFQLPEADRKVTPTPPGNPYRLPIDDEKDHVYYPKYKRPLADWMMD